MWLDGRLKRLITTLIYVYILIIIIRVTIIVYETSIVPSAQVVVEYDDNLLIISAAATR